MIDFIDAITNRITMYRLVLYYLGALAAAAFLLGLFKLVPVDPAALLWSTVLLTAACLLVNQLFAWVFRAVPNVESVYITALILALIVDPVQPANFEGDGLLIAVSVWAMASKYMLSVRRRHVFNPAAFGVALAGFAVDQPASWWVSGVVPLLPLVLVGGLLVTRKLRRFDLVIVFALVNIAATLLTSAPADYATQLEGTFLRSPFFFFAFVMLTEPLTAPQHKLWRLAYGALVGFLASPNIAIAGFYFAPETALLVGNLLTLAVSPAGRTTLTLERIEEAGKNVFDFVFRADRRLAFAAGQYLEWTIPLRHPDDRGNRRYFTIASGPSEPEVRLGVKFYPGGSAFKRRLAALRPGDTISASQLAGSFTLPARRATKIAFIAGGIGITPFRSMLVEELAASGSLRPITILYGCNSAADIAYRDVLEAARERLGIPTHYVVMDGEGAEPGMSVGVIDADTIGTHIPDYADRLFYISGPQPMVAAVRRILRGMGVPPWRIRTDFFPGLA